MMKRSVLFFLLVLIPFAAFGDGTINTGTDSVAIKGYDVVAYFKQRRAIKGRADFSHRYKGAIWHFASADNLALFKASPDAYIPQYGGYCAYAMATYGGKTRTDPTAFTLKDNKLYLNYNTGINRRFTTDPENYIIQADNNWQKFATD